MRVVEVVAGRDTIRAEVAETGETRQLGLMYRLSMPTDAGMLFVFDEPGIYPFWMRNTEFPLSIAFIDDRLRIVDLQDMTPHDETSLHAPASPVRYALEVNHGWFDAHEVKVGDSVILLPGGAR